MDKTKDNSGCVGEQQAKSAANPHDKRFKELFSNKKSFLSFLKDCVKEPWVDEIDEASLTKTNSSFIPK